MIRWRYLLSRVLIVALIIVLLRAALGPTIRQITERTLQSATGARVDIAAAHVDLWPPRVYYEDVRIADPSKDREDAVRVELVDVKLDADALLRRNWVIDRARITGIDLNEERSTSGRLASEPPTDSPKPGNKLSNKLGDMIKTAASERADAFTESLETKRVAIAVQERWKGEYINLTMRAARLEEAIREIRESVRGVDNPLRDLPQLQKTLERAEAIRQELLVVRKAIDDLPGAVQHDLVRLDQARRNDMDRIGQYLPMPLDSETKFSSDMFRQMVTMQLDRVRRVLDGSRSVADWTVRSPEAQRARGKVINLIGSAAQPNWLVRSAEVSGILQIDGTEYDLSGVLENVSGEPAKADGPMVARIKMAGPQTVRVDYHRHTTNERTWDELTMHWPELPIRTLSVGDADSDASIRMQPGALELWVEMRVEGDTVEGRMLSKMRNARVMADIKSNEYNEVMVASLIRSLQGISEVDVEARYRGDWSAMQIDVSSNLSKVFSSSLRNSLAVQAEATKQKLVAKLNDAYRAEVGELQIWLSEQQGEVRTVLGRADTSVEEVSRKLVQELGAPELYLGRLRRGLPKF